MNENITTETPNTYSPYATNTDRLRLPEIEENDQGVLTVYYEPLQPLVNRLGNHLMFRSTAQREAAQRIINNPPKTLGELWYDYLNLVAANATAVKNLTALERGLGKVNTAMNEYADDQNWCGQYDETLPTFTRMLVEEGYTGWFEFIGRVEEVNVTVERRRVVTETITFSMERVKGAEFDYDSAIDLADGCDTEMWDIQDDCYDTDGYEVIDVTSAY